MRGEVHPGRARPPRPRRQGRQRLPGPARQRRAVAGGPARAAATRASSSSACSGPRASTCVAVPIAGRTRSNITLAEPDGTVTKINEPGPALSAAEFDAITEARARRAPAGADWVVVCGSLPPGLPVEAFGAALPTPASAPASGSRSTPAARRCGPRPWPARRLLKPNRDELAEVVGAPLRSTRRRRRRRPAAAVLGRRRGAGQPRRRRRRAGRRRRRRQRRLARSTGPAARSAPATRCWPGSSPPAPRGSAALAEALAWGAAAVSLPGSRMPGPATCAAITSTSTSHRSDSQPDSRLRPPAALQPPAITMKESPHGHTVHPAGHRDRASRPASSASAATSPAWSCPTSARSSPGV